ncbi:hypothetical protein [Anaerocolumna jejuensis]|uniref:hypothetical protein n=1 Tax=Anaerocolumna jejuensis TaxID=259063 RepID=UPI003F7BCCCE
MKLHESETIELRENFTSEFKNEIMAFANMNGGTTSATASEDAVRETLLNAIVHREFSFRGSTIINLFFVWIFDILMVLLQFSS